MYEINTRVVGKECEDEEKEASEKLTNAEFIYEFNKEHIKKKNYQEIFVMTLLSTIFVVAVITSGMAAGYSAVLLPQLKNTNGTLHIDDDMGSWIASVFPVSSPFGAIISGILMDSVGRRLTMQTHSIAAAIGWICILFCENHALLLLGRLISGFSAGIGLTSVQIYIAEVSKPEMRGVLGCIPFASSSFGVLLVFILGSVIHWRLIAGFAIIPSICAIAMYFIVCESPDWLIRKGRIKEARKAFLWLRGNDVVQVEKEMEQLISKFEYEKLNAGQDSMRIWDHLSTSQVLKPLIIINVFTLLHLLSGWYILILYAVEIISYMEIDINEYLAAVIYAGVRFAFTIVAAFTIAFIGRRPLGICSAFSAGICSFCIALCLYFDFSKDRFIALCLLLYVAFSTIGFSTLPTILAAELFPAKTRAIAGSITLIVASTITFSYAKLFPYLKYSLGIDGMFMLFGISSILAGLFVYATMPETKDKTLLEIEDYFSNDNILWVNRNKKRKNRRDIEQVEPINA